MRRSRVRRLLLLVLLLIAASGLSVLAPSSIGGRATWVSTFGVSMRPSIHAGDLAIVRPKATYAVGDVVAYPSTTLNGTVVLHRIVTRNGDSFVTKGDHNTWTDPDQPRSSDILGALWLHIPQGGRVLTLLTNPLTLAALAALAALLGWVGTTRLRGRGRHRDPQPARRSPTTGWGRWAAGTGLAAVALGVIAWGQPATTMVTRSRPIVHTGQLGYQQSVATPGVYEDNKIRTGDPVFLSVATTLTATLDYQLGFDPGPVTGTVTSTVRIAATNGWSRQLPLGEAETIQSPHVDRSVSLDLGALLRLAHAAENRAHASFGSYTVTVVHHVDATGTVAGQQVTTSTQPQLRLTLTGEQATLQREAGAAASGTAVPTADTTTVSIPRATPTTVPVLRWDVPLGAARGATIALAAAALLLAALARRQRQQPAPSPRTLLGDRLIEVSHVDSRDLPVVEVDDHTALARLADRHDTVILHTAQGPDDLFVLIADQTLYRLRTQAHDQTGQEPGHATTAMGRPVGQGRGGGA